MRSEFGSDTALGASTPAEGGPIYAGYVAALDREEQAARIRADHVERFSCISEQSVTAGTAA